VQGDKPYAKAKIKIMYYEGKRGVNCAYNFDGTQDWHDRTLLADVSNAVTRAQLQLGIQNGTGTVYFDNLIVDDGVMSHTAVSLAPAANASHPNRKAIVFIACFSRAEGQPSKPTRSAAVTRRGGDFAGRSPQVNHVALAHEPDAVHAEGQPHAEDVAHHHADEEPAGALIEDGAAELDDHELDHPRNEHAEPDHPARPVEAREEADRVQRPPGEEPARSE